MNGYRNVAKATECLLINENVLKDGDGNYYQKIEEEEEEEEVCEESSYQKTGEGKPAKK